MRKLRHTIGIAVAALAAAVLVAPVAHAADPLASFVFRVAGAELRVAPAALAVPKGIAGSVSVDVLSGDGSRNAATAALAAGAVVEATLRGPSFAARRLVGAPDTPLRLPPLHLVGEYQLDDIKLIDGTTGELRLEGTPRSVPVQVFEEVLVSRVTSRPLTLAEIEQRGIYVDESSFRVLEFQVGFVVDGQTIPVKFPVVSPQLIQSTEIVPRAEVEELLAEADALNAEFSSGVELPPELESAGLDLQVRGINFQLVQPSEGEDLALEAPPIAALLLIPGSIGLLNQFFSVQLFTENAAPPHSALAVYDIDAELRLPRGIDGIPGTHAAPGDDPLRFARIGPDRVTQPIQRLATPGPDGQLGNDDDVQRLFPGDTGQAEFLVEGLEEGLHVLDLVLRGRLDGLAAGPVEITGRAAGSVLVRNPSFSMAFSHPRTIRAGEPYTASVTILNTSPSPANLVSVRLPAGSLSGAAFEPGQGESVELGTIAPGETRSAEFRLRAQRTGSISFSQLITDDAITGRFRLKMGVDERGVALSPDAIGYPEYVADVEALAPEVMAAATRVLGQALSVSTAAVRPPGLLAVSKRTVTSRVLELAEAGQRLRYGDAPERVLADLLLDWQGARTASAGFDQILRTTDAGREWREALMAAQEAAEPGTAVERLLARASDLAGRGEGWQITATGHSAVEPAFYEGDTESSLYRNEIAEASALRGSRGHWLVTRPATPPQSFRFDAVADAGAFSLAWLDLDGAGGGRLLRWSLGGASAGDCFRFTPAAGTDLAIDRGCDGSTESTQQAVESPVAELAPVVLSARQDLAVRVGRPVDSCWQNEDRNYATVVAVLFSKPMTQARAGLASAYRLDDGNVGKSVQIQPSGRVALVNLAAGVGRIRPIPPATRNLVVAGVADPRGNPVDPTPVPVDATGERGVAVTGVVVGSDGRPAAGVPVTLTMLDEVATIEGCGGWTRRISQVRAGDDGRFAFDFVLAGIPYSISATDTRGLSAAAADLLLESTKDGAVDRSRLESLAEDPATRDTLLGAFSAGATSEAVALAEGVDRALLRDLVALSSPRIGTAVPVALRFRGRGSVSGIVTASDGVTPLSGVAVNLFPDPDSREKGRGLFSDSNGRFAFYGVPLGVYSVEATTGAGLHRTVSDSLDAVGEADELAVVLSAAAVPRSGLRGRVLEADGVTPHGGARVLIGKVGKSGEKSIVNGVVASVTADGLGSWDATDLPVGSWDVVAISADGRRRGEVRNVLAAAGAVNFADVRLADRAEVTVEVLFANGDRVAGALVSGGEMLVTTGADGRAVVPGVPIGDRTLAAGFAADPANSDPRRHFTRSGRTRAQIVPGVANHVVIRLPEAGRIFGQVRDAAGRPVGGIQVAIPVGDDGFLYTEADGEGRFEFGNLGLDDYVVSAPAPGTANTDVSGILDTLSGDPSQDDLLAAITAAYEIFTGVNDPLLNPVPFNPLTWGYTRVRLDADGVSREANIDYLTPGTVRGTVLNGQGVPIGARVRLTGVGPTANGDVTTVIRGERNSDPALGTFAFEGQVLEGSFGLQAASPFFPTVVTASGQITDVEPAPPPITLRFPPVVESNGRITGTVVDPDGLPVAGVSIYIHFGADCSFANRDACVRRVTDASGRFGDGSQLFDLPASTLGRPASYRVEAIDAFGSGLVGSSLATLSPGQTTDVTIELLDRGSLSLLVREGSGAPAAAAAVTVQGLAYPNEMLAGTTDANGQLALGPMPAGSYAVEARWVSGAATTRGRTTATVIGGAVAAATVTLGPTADLHGRFLARDGVTPIGFAQITVGNLGFAATDADGAFRVDGLPLGTYQLVGRDAVTGRMGLRSVTLDRAGEDREIVLLERATGDLEGAVIGSDGTSRIAAATVELSFLDGVTPRRTATTDPSGAFRFPATPAGPFRLRATDPVTNVVGSVDASFPEGTALFRVDVRLSARASFGVRVFEPDGVTPATADVRLDASAGVPALQTDLEGRARFTDVRLGHFEIEARDRRVGQTRSVGAAAVSLTRAGPLADEIPIVLAGVGRVVGQIYESDGTTPATLAAAELFFASEPFAGTSAQPSQLADGAFAFDDVPVGAFRVAARDGALGAVANGTIAAAGDERVVDLVLGASGSVFGRVVDPDGAPVAGADVALRFVPQSAAQGNALFRTGADGRFRFDDIPVGEVSLAITASAVGGIRSAPRPDEGPLALGAAGLDLGDLALDVEAPAVASVEPAHTATGVPTDVAIELSMSEALLRTSDPGGLDPSGIYLQSGATRVPASVALDAADPTHVTLRPDAPLASETTFQLVVANGDLLDALGQVIARGPRDLEGRPLRLPFVSQFTTRDDDPPGLLSLTPADGAEQVATSAVLRLSFDERLASGGISIAVVDDQGAAVPGAVALGVDARVVVFTPAALLAPNRSYTATVSGVADLAGNAAAGQPLVTHFATVDTLGPAIASLQIRGGAAPIAGSTITLEALLAEPEDGASLRMTIDFADAGVGAPGILALPIRLPDGPGRITVRAVAIDRHGNEGPTAELPIDVLGNAPPTVTLARVAPPAGPVPSGSTLVVDVSAADDFGVTLLRAQASGGAGFPLATTAGTPISVTVPIPASAGPGSVTIRGEALDAAGASSGEQTLVVPVSDGVAPAVAIATPAGGSLFDPGANFDVVVDASDGFGVTEIELSASGPVSGGGVRAFAPAATTAQALFRIAIPPDAPPLAEITLTATARDAAGHAATTASRIVRVRDLVAPAVVGVEPADGAVDVPVSTVVRVTFSEPIAPGSATTASVRLETAGAVAVPATLSLGAGNTKVTIRPDAPLDDGVGYAVHVAPSITDTAGNALAAAFASSFTTDLDELGPRLLSLEPADGASGVSIRPLLRARFDDAIERASIGPDAFQLLDVDGGDAPVAAELSFENGDRDLVLRPAGALGFDRAYAVSLAATLRGTDGNPIRGSDGQPLVVPLVQGFRTGLFGITAPRDASSVTEGVPLAIDAQASAGLGVASVEFSVNGERIATVENPPYRASFDVPAAALTSSLAIGAVARDADGAEVGVDAVTVAVERGLAIEPALVGVPVGQSRALRVRASSAPAQPTVVTLAAAVPGVVSFPAEVTIPAGAREVEFDVLGATAGNTAIVATGPFGSAGAVISASEPASGEDETLVAVIGASVQPVASSGQLFFAAPGVHRVEVPLLATPATASTPVVVASTRPSVAAVANAPVIPAGASSAAVDVEAFAPGTTLLVFDAGGVMRQLLVVVGTPPSGIYEPAFQSIGAVIQNSVPPRELDLPGAGSHTLVLPLLAAPAAGEVPVTVASSDPAIARVDGPLAIAAGAQTLAVTIEVGATGTAVLRFDAGAESILVTVRVGGSGDPRKRPRSLVGAAVVKPFLQVFLAPGESRTLTVPLLPYPALFETQGTATSNAGAIASIAPAAFTFAAAAPQQQSFTFTAGATPGVAVIDVRLPQDRFAIQVVVGDPAQAEIPETRAPLVGVTVETGNPGD